MQNTTPLHQAVYDYYCHNFEKLTFGKRLHFTTRLAHWDGDQFCTEQLSLLKSEFTSGIDPEQKLRQVFEKHSGVELKASKNAAELRQPYFLKYPELRTANILLFRALVYIQTYHIDCRSLIDELYPDDAIGQLLDRLYRDQDAVAILSTHAINTQYLYRRLLRQSDETSVFDPHSMYELGKTYYDLSNKTHLKLYIYLYTHCIIGESLFYTRRIPTALRPAYLDMLRDLETIIDQHYDDINLDNKCEYLACCQILGITSILQAKIEAECRQSISPEGLFLIDTLNRNPQTDSTDFNKSEHRNVLYIMANRPYRPQDNNVS